MIYIFLVLIGIFLSLINITNNKYIKWIYTIATLIIMVYLMGTVSPYHSFDTAAYQYMYDLPPVTHRFEIGYMSFSYYFYEHGFTYETFRICSYTVFVILMFLGVKKLTPNLIGFYSLYLIFPFFLDVTQVRQFFMFSLVIFGVGMLCGENKYLRWIGTISILISPLFQSSGFLYYLLFILNRVNYKKMLKIMDYLIWIMPVLTLVIHYAHLNKFISGTLAFVLSSRSNAAESVTIYTQGSAFSIVLWYIVSIMVSYYVFRKIALNVKCQNNVLTYLVNIFFIAVITIPLLASSSDFERFIRNGIFALLIVFSIYISQLGKVGSHLWLKTWTCILCVGVLATTAWKYWNTSSQGRNQYLPYIIKVKDPNDM